MQICKTWVFVWWKRLHVHRNWLNFSYDWIVDNPRISQVPKAITHPPPANPFSYEIEFSVFFQKQMCHFPWLLSVWFRSKLYGRIIIVWNGWMVKMALKPFSLIKSERQTTYFKINAYVYGRVVTANSTGWKILDSKYECERRKKTDSDIME